MESSEPAQAALTAADAARDRLARSVVLPPYFHTAIGAAVAAQIGSAAWALADPDRIRFGALIAGCVVFLVVAAGVLAAFRRRTGVWVGGLFSRAVMGTTVSSSLVYTACLVGAVWAATTGRGLLAAAAAVLGGAGYALCGHLWWQAYRRDPVGHARAGTLPVMAVMGTLVLLGALVLVANR